MSAQIKVFNSWYTWSESFNEVYSFLSTYGKDYFSKFETGDHSESDSDSTVGGKYIDCYAKDKSGTEKKLIRFNFGTYGNRNEKIVWLCNTSGNNKHYCTWSNNDGIVQDRIGFGNYCYYKAAAVTDNGILIWINANTYFIVSKSEEDLTCISGVFNSDSNAYRIVNYAGKDGIFYPSSVSSYLDSGQRYCEIGTYHYASGMTVLCPIVVANTYLPHVFDVRYTNISLPVGTPSIISIKGTEYVFTGAHAFN